ncbi:MAG: DUF4954 family protein [Rikenellaceae bacterium]
MSQLREVTPDEIKALAQRSCYAEDWSRVRVAHCFDVAQLSMSRFGGDVELHAGVQVHNSTVINYRLLEGSRVERTAILECRGQSSFGNGVSVASLNECGGRSVKIHELLTSQVAYIATVYRHRPQLIARIEAMADSFADARRSTMGSVGRGSTILGAGVIRNLWVDDSVTIEGSSAISNGTILAGGYFGADVKAHDFIAVEGARVDNGALVERCFVGENVILSNGFTAVDSLFFASSHCENGEAVSTFAGACTVSHHKSSLLIAGMFSFFNAGSGANQSNHLFKCGPVHQGVNLRGCKFGSSAYVMLPAVNGAYTSMLGSHNSHHDTTNFPFSYLVNKEGRSTLIPAANIATSGYMRDIKKWVARDKRRLKRDTINFEEHNPYIAGMVIEAINTTNSLLDKNPDAPIYIYNNMQISGKNLNRGLTLYNKFIAGSLGAMLSYGDSSREGEGRCRWVDLGGQYITKRALEAILVRIESGVISELQDIDRELRDFATSFEAYAYDWALGILTELLGDEPSAEQIAQTIEAAQRSRSEIEAMAAADMARDTSEAMEVSYGIDSEEKSERHADFNAVRGL